MPSPSATTGQLAHLRIAHIKKLRPSCVSWLFLLVCMFANLRRLAIFKHAHIA